MEIYKLSSSEHFSVVGSNKDYEEIILAEGSHSENRTRAGIKSVRTTAARLQIAGEVQTPTLGRMVKFYRTENNDSMISYTMETMGADKVWLVADIHAESIEPDATFTRIVSESFIKGTVEYETEQRRLNDAFEQEKNRKILLEFRRLAGPLLGKSPDEMKKLKIGGAFEKSNLPSVFWLDQRISTKATEGDNLRLVGDAVGNATPTVGGGMQIGATSHLESAKNLYFNLELLHYSLKSRHISLSEYQEAKIVAIKKYDASVLQDTLSWHIQGVPDMYLHLQDGGVEINRLPEGHQHAEEFNIIVDELNKKLLETTPEAIVKLSRISAANYYHVPSSEIKTEAGMKKWIKKVKDWAYHDFVRKAFKLGLVKWYKHEVESPYHYLNEVLPQRPEKGLKFPSWMSNANIIPYKLHMNRCKTFYRADH
ncbi:MAG: hypothetical protein L6Q37_04560, partial [Bdellovibrionaceae bacterium]|nr:hypothetical protein [Pseudobdellovibrionaceae bacterium]